MEYHSHKFRALPVLGFPKKGGVSADGSADGCVQRESGGGVGCVGV